MNRMSGVLAVCFIALCIGCKGKEPAHNRMGKETGVYTLSWPNYNGASENHDKATYVLDGEVLGTGHMGYERFVERLKTLPIGSVVKVDFIPYDGLGGGEGYCVPLSFEEREYRRVAESRHITLEFPPPGGWQ